MLLSQHVPTITEKSHTIMSKQLVSQPRFETGTSQMQVSSITAWANLNDNVSHNGMRISTSVLTARFSVLR